MRNTTVDIYGEQVPGVIEIPESGSGPAVIVIQEWWGLVPHIQDVVRRFADEGFVALAVDHYRGAETTEPDHAGKLMIGLNIGQVSRDLAAAADSLLARPEVTGETVCVVGFCMGGGLSLLGPSSSDAIVKASAFYPALPWPDFAPDWTKYRGKAAIVHLAEHDDPDQPAAIAAYGGQIEANGGSIEVFNYPGTHHAFFNDERPEVYDAAASELAWQRMLAFFRS